MRKPLREKHADRGHESLPGRNECLPDLPQHLPCDFIRLYGVGIVFNETLDRPYSLGPNLSTHNFLRYPGDLSRNDRGVVGCGRGPFSMSSLAVGLFLKQSRTATRMIRVLSRSHRYTFQSIPHSTAGESFLPILSAERIFFVGRPFSSQVYFFSRIGFFKRQGSHPFHDHTMPDIVGNSHSLTGYRVLADFRLARITGPAPQPFSIRAKQALNQIIRYHHGVVSLNDVIGLQGRIL